MVRLRCLAEEPKQEPDAGAENDEVRHDENSQRRCNTRLAYRRHAVGRAQQAVDSERLPSAFRDNPTSGDGDEARRTHRDRPAQQPPRVEQATAPSQDQRDKAERDHQQADADHDSKRPEHKRNIGRPVLARESLQSLDFAVPVVRQIQARESRDCNLRARFSRLRIGQAEQDRGRVPLRLEVAFHRGHLRRLVLEAC